MKRPVLWAYAAVLADVAAQMRQSHVGAHVTGTPRCGKWNQVVKTGAHRVLGPECRIYWLAAQVTDPPVPFEDLEP